MIGIDTAARVGGVAIVADDRFLGAQVFGIEASHSEHLLPALESLMERLDLEPRSISGIAVSQGPGSFTGLRIGLAAAKVLAYAWQIPLLGVSTLRATAWPFRGVDAVMCATLDARRESVYLGLYDGLTMQSDPLGPRTLLGEEARVEIEEVARELGRFVNDGRRVILVGDGSKGIYEALRSNAVLAEHGDRVAWVPLDAEPARPVSVAHLGEVGISLGQRDDPFSIVPNYLRRSEAERRWRRRQS